MEFFYRRYKMSMLVGLVRMKSRDDLKGMVSAISASKVVEVYMVTPTITFSLPWDSPNVKWKSNVIITEILETEIPTLRGDESRVEIPTQDDGCYVPEKGSHQ
ncbi:hypothetical protein Fot_14861 [Forsythia ovata]|uniref:Uncharacterized protein n=1 Tax=Forsythia ovata TaxID=205694 RepID=A0ABD1WA25_9LAMI